MLRTSRRGAAGPVARALGFAATDAHALTEICYLAILGRAPDPLGLRSYVAMIEAQPDRETLIAMVRSISMSEEARDYREHHLSIRSQSRR